MQESFISYLPKNYIKDKESQEEYVCTICMQLKLSILRCRGPCQKPICQSCVGKIKSEKDVCPSRCSAPFETEQIPQLNLQLACPYEPSQCKQIIKTAEQFKNHCQVCIFMSEEQKKQSEHQQQYRCQRNHLLTFLTDQNYQLVYRGTSLSFYKHTCREVCSICNEQSNIRSICLQCSSTSENGKLVEFCVTCRPLPCSKRQCPIGHQVAVQQKVGYSMICDFCGQHAAFNGKLAYEDLQCNYDICQKCYNNLPEEHALVPLQNFIDRNWDNKQKPKIEEKLQSAGRRVNRTYEEMEIQLREMMREGPLEDIPFDLSLMYESLLSSQFEAMPSNINPQQDQVEFEYL